MDDKLDQYLRETNKELKSPRRKPRLQRQWKATRETALKRWAASAAMDLFKLYMPLMALAVAGGFCLLMDLQTAALYCLYAFIAVAFAGLTLCAIDFYKYQTWPSRLTYKVEGWNNILLSRNPSYWDMNGEHWLPVKIVIILKEPVNPKHVTVVEAFLKKLRKRLNQWTVSKEEHFGYSQPNGWSHDGMILSGDMNPRVLNRIRKRLSGELDELSKLMPGAIEKVVITQTGSQQFHKVYVDPSSD
jgi:hypothetical protein